MPPSALSAKTCVVCHFGRLLWEGNSAALFVQQSCQQTSSCSRHRDLGTHTRRASHDCHALRYHSGADGEGVPMPPSALSAENCVSVLYWVGAAALFSFFSRGLPLQQSIFK